jgi:hypothetical protein
VRDIEAIMRKLRRRTKPQAYSRAMRLANNAQLHREHAFGWEVRWAKDYPNGWSWEMLA